ncbi:aquaporin-4-like [Saccoglossus kowalevskii]|uniref:Aquaporin-4-like n=1 Tax=Saccoglossus kowalevskii TaxID=10224 RepID=A0ABM0MAB5_SACKO|nr:PREDICTED: aquaporin-4-like [Saccoglossus kowalevskii]
MANCKDDIRNQKFWRALVGEFIGTLFIVFFGIGSSISWNPPHTPSVVQISLCSGLTVATMIQCFVHVSGAHFNPAITCTFLVTRQISVLRAFLYLVSQLIGAIAGAGLIYAVTPAGVRGGLGTTSLGAGVTAEQGFAIEYMITFVLLFTLCATIDPKRTDLQGSGPLAVGLSVVIGVLFAVGVTHDITSAKLPYLSH